MMQDEILNQQKTILRFEEKNGVTFEHENVITEEPVEEKIADWGD